VSTEVTMDGLSRSPDGTERCSARRSQSMDWSRRVQQIRQLWAWLSAPFAGHEFSLVRALRGHTHRSARRPRGSCTLARDQRPCGCAMVWGKSVRPGLLARAQFKEMHRAC
jgi:hypothetical protein